jgi:hypothetical protein
MASSQIFHPNLSLLKNSWLYFLTVIRFSWMRSLKDPKVGARLSTHSSLFHLHEDQTQGLGTHSTSLVTPSTCGFLFSPIKTQQTPWSLLCCWRIRFSIPWVLFTEVQSQLPPHCAGTGNSENLTFYQLWLRTERFKPSYLELLIFCQPSPLVYSIIAPTCAVCHYQVIYW